MKSGVFVVSELNGPARDRILEVQQWADPRLAAGQPPHITLAGSSGAGPMPAGTTAEEIREKVAGIFESTPPITVQLQRPHRFMQTDIMVLPVDPHGPLRTLHERIAGSGLKFERPRFPYSPHVTLSFYPRLTPEMERRLLALRVEDPVVISRVQFYLTLEPQPPRLLLELALNGGSQQSTVNSQQ